MADPIAGPSAGATQYAQASQGGPRNDGFQPWTNQQYIERMEREPCRSFVVRAPNETTLMSPDHPDRPGLTLQSGPEADRLLERARELGVKVYEHQQPIPNELFASHDVVERYQQRFAREGSDNPSCRLVSGLQPPTIAGAGLGRRSA